MAWAGWPTGSDVEVYSVRPDGTDPRRLTDDSAFDACATYDATGRRIAFCNARTGNNEIWTMKADGSHQRQVTRPGGSALFPDFAPNGHRATFSWVPQGSAAVAGLWSVRRDGRKLRQLTNSPDVDEAFPAYSPTGRRWSSSAATPSGPRARSG